MTEDEFAQAQALTENRIAKAIAERVIYKANVTTCQNSECGVDLPPARHDIGICLDCAEDAERRVAAQRRNGEVK